MPDGDITPEDIAKVAGAGPTAYRQKEELQKQALLLGYNVEASTGIKYGIGAEPTITFQVWRVDQQQPSPDAPSFTSVEEVKRHLDQIATWPKYGLDLVGNPQVEVDSESDSPFTVVIVRDSGEELILRTRDLETATTLYIHAEESPTVGNWYLASD